MQWRRNVGTMQVLREPQIVSGFVYEKPVDDLPELTHCGEALCCEGHQLKPHRHRGYEFLYLLRGRATWRSRGQTVEQHSGDLYIAYPGELHRTGAVPNPENQHLWVGLDIAKLGPHGRRLHEKLQRERPHLLAGCGEIETVLRGVLRQVISMRARRTEAILAGLSLLMELIEQRWEDLEGGSAGLSSEVSHLPYSYGVEKAVAYLHANLESRLPLADIAGIATARSIPHFCTQFRREVGVAPAAYHLQLRLEAARDALRQPVYDVTAVALQFGFSSSQHFSTQFRRMFGQTPSEWRATASSGK